MEPALLVVAQAIMPLTQPADALARPNPARQCKTFKAKQLSGLAA
jgi:hypothetical protein